MQLYGSRIRELAEERGEYTVSQAERDMEMLLGQTYDNLKELTYYEKKAVHNLKYFTWIEQQAKDLSELNAQWYDHDTYWNSAFDTADRFDELAAEFNEMIEKG